MSNKKPRFIEITPENEQQFKDQFCTEVGHTNKCVDDTVQEMSRLLKEYAYTRGISPADYLKSLSVEEFDSKLKNLLLIKTCNCGRGKRLN